MPVGPIDLIQITAVHRNNEDWLMRLPVVLPEGQTLDGVKAKCVLRRRESEIVFPTDEGCYIDGNDIVLDLQSQAFAGLSGTYQGDVLLKFPDDFDIVTHLITVDIVKGTTTW